MNDVSIATCEYFLHHFVDKVDSLRKYTSKSVIMNTNKDLLITPAHSAVFDQFELVSLNSLGDGVKS